MTNSRICAVRCSLLGLFVTALSLRSAAGQSTFRDSAGVRLTPITLRGHTGVLKLSPRPTIDIGGAPGDSSYDLNRVRGAVRLHDGTIVVANNNPQQLRFFDARGRFIRTAGRKGNGPGEFQSLTHLWALRGDTLLVFDAPAQRISLFRSNGDHLSTQILVAPKGRRQPTILGAFADQRLLAGSSDVQTAPPRATPYYFGQHVFIYGLDGQPGQDVGPFTESEHFVQHTVPEHGGTAYWDLAYGRRTSIVARGNEVIVGDGTTFELRSFTRAGRLQEIWRALTAPERLTERERAAYRADALKGLAPSGRAIEEKRLDEMPYPALIPAFKRFFVADDGRIWIQRYTHVGESQERWVVLDGHGQFLDELTMPARFSLWAAGAGYVLGGYHDEDDIEHVQEFTLASG